MSSRWPRRTITCADCGEERPHAGLGRCGACYNAHRRAHPEGRVHTHNDNGYKNGCRCEVCTEAHRIATAGQRATVYLNPAVSADPVPGVTHGLRYAYEDRGCRCEVCVTAQVARGRIVRPRERVSAS